MKFRPLAISVGIAGLLALAACGGPGEPRELRSTGARFVQSRTDGFVRARTPRRRQARGSGERVRQEPECRSRGTEGHVGGADLDLRPRRGHRLVHLRPPYPRGGPLARTGADPAGGVRQLVPAGLRGAARRRVRRARRRRHDWPPRDEAVLRVGLQTRATDAAARRPANLTFVVDVSGSMAEPGRLDLVKRALHTLIDQLAPGDQVAIVAFSDEADGAGLDDPARRPGRPARGGRPARSWPAAPTWRPGCCIGYEQAAKASAPRATNRVILLSDGLANQGSTDAGDHPGPGQGAGRQAGHAADRRRRPGLRRRADGAAGRQRRRLRRLRLARARTRTRSSPRSSRPRSSCGPGTPRRRWPSTPRSWRATGSSGTRTAQLATEDFRDDTRDGGEVGPGHSVTALYAVRLKSGATGNSPRRPYAGRTPTPGRPPRRAAGRGGRADRRAVGERAGTAAGGRGGGGFRAVHAGPGGVRADLDALGEQGRRLAGEAEDPMVTELVRTHRQGSLGGVAVDQEFSGWAASLRGGQAAGGEAARRLAGAGRGPESDTLGAGSRGYGAVGSAPPWHGGGLGFESP